MEKYGFRYIENEKHYLSMHVVYYTTRISSEDLVNIMNILIRKVLLMMLSITYVILMFINQLLKLKVKNLDKYLNMYYLTKYLNQMTLKIRLIVVI